MTACWMAAWRTVAVAAVMLLALGACKPPPAPTAAPEPTAAQSPQASVPGVTPSADLRGASDDAPAPPAIGALTGGQAARGGASRPMEATAGDGARPASAASR